MPVINGEGKANAKKVLPAICYRKFFLIYAGLVLSIRPILSLSSLSQATVPVTHISYASLLENPSLHLLVLLSLICMFSVFIQIDKIKFKRFFVGPMWLSILLAVAQMYVYGKQVWLGVMPLLSCLAHHYYPMTNSVYWRFMITPGRLGIGLIAIPLCAPLMYVMISILRRLKEQAKLQQSNNLA